LDRNPFEVADDGRYVVKLELTALVRLRHVPGCARRQAPRLAAEPLQPTTITQDREARPARVAKGKHTLRFTCKSADQKSKLAGGGPGFYFGLDAVELRLMPPAKPAQ